MSEQDKYQDFFANDLDELVKKTDKLVKMGYKIQATHWIRETPYLMHRTMSLSSSPDLKKYELFENADIGSQKQRELENLGYKAIANYSKHITWGRPVDSTT